MPEKAKRGFAVMDPARQREIASRGGKRAHALGKAPEWTTEQAKIAGQKGGRASNASHRKIRDDRRSDADLSE